jgi:hypothetical protein
MSEIPMAISYKLTNKSVLTGTSETAQTASMAELLDIIPYYKKKGEYYEQRAIQYLKEKFVLFPEYTNYGPGLDVIRPKRLGYSCSIPLNIPNPKYLTIPERYQGNGFLYEED